MKTFSRPILVVLLLALTAFARTPSQTYQNLSPPGRQAFIKEKAHRIAAAIAGHPTEFSSAFLSLVEAKVDSYADRVGNNQPISSGREDFRFVLERGASLSQSFSRIFETRKLSPLLGLYLALMESEYMNESLSQTGSAGMFQFMEPTAIRFGLRPEERADPLKSADAAARYLAESATRFAGDPWLALLAYNQGEISVETMLGIVPEARRSVCSVCSLTEKKELLGPGFRDEGVHYLPAFFAAAILGEFPGHFGLSSPPLSVR